MEQKILSLKDDKIHSEVELIEYPEELRGGRNLAIMSRMKKGYIAGRTGAIGSSNVDVHDPNYYPCIAGDKFISKVHDLGELPRGDVGFMAFYDIDKQFISSLAMVHNAVGATRTATAPIGAKFYRYASTGIAVKFKLERGNKATDWTPAPEDLNLSYPDFITEFKPSISDRYILTEELIEYPEELRGGRNLAIMSRMKKGYIAGRTGAIGSSNVDVHDPNYYPCIAGDKFISKVHDLGELPRGDVGFMAFYDIDKQFISSLAMVHNAVGATRTATAPIGAKFYRYASTGIAVKFKLERGNKATDWTPAPEDLDLSYPDHIQSFGTSFSNNILINEFIEQ